jgi:hypothetical protein
VVEKQILSPIFDKSSPSNIEAMKLSTTIVALLSVSYASVAGWGRPQGQHLSTHCSRKRHHRRHHNQQQQQQQHQRQRNSEIQGDSGEQCTEQETQKPSRYKRRRQIPRFPKHIENTF